MRFVINKYILTKCLLYLISVPVILFCVSVRLPADVS